MIGLPGSWRVNSLNIDSQYRFVTFEGMASCWQNASISRNPANDVAINGSSMARPGSIASLDQTRHGRVIDTDFFLLS